MSDDPFMTLGVQPRFDLDEAELERRMLALSSEHHPDRFTDPLDQADAAERIAAVNGAYRALVDPGSRGAALLRHHGGAAEGRAGGGEDEKALPPEFLMEVMEVREAMEAAVAGEDAEALARLRAWAEGQRSERLAALARLFDASPVDHGAVRMQLNALRYAERMLEQMPG